MLFCFIEEAICIFKIKRVQGEFNLLHGNSVSIKRCDVKSTVLHSLESTSRFTPQITSLKYAVLCFLLLLLNLLSNKLGVVAQSQAATPPLNQPRVPTPPCNVIYEPAVKSCFLLADGLVSEGEFLDITEIKRQQAEDYECITNNGVAPPDQRKVKVTVNCKYLSKSPAASYFNSAAELRRYSRMMYY